MVVHYTSNQFGNGEVRKVQGIQKKPYQTQSSQSHTSSHMSFENQQNFGEVFLTTPDYHMEPQIFVHKSVENQHGYGEVKKIQGILKRSSQQKYPLSKNTLRYEGLVAWTMSPEQCSFCIEMRTPFKIRDYLVFPATHNLTCLETGEHKECNKIRSGLRFHELFDHVYLAKLKVSVSCRMHRHLEHDPCLFNELLEFLLSLQGGSLGWN